MRELVADAAALALAGCAAEAQEGNAGEGTEQLYSDPDAGALTGLTTAMVRFFCFCAHSSLDLEKL